MFEVFRAAQVAAIEEGVAQGLVKATHASALVAVVRALVDGLMVQRVLTNVDLAPVHALVWERFLAPLKSGIPPPHPPRRKRQHLHRASAPTSEKSPRHAAHVRPSLTRGENHEDTTVGPRRAPVAHWVRPHLP